MKIKNLNEFNSLNESRNYQINDYETELNEYSQVTIQGLGKDVDVASATARIKWYAEIEDTSLGINSISPIIIRVEIEYETLDLETDKEESFEVEIDDSEKISVDYESYTLPMYIDYIVYDVEKETVEVTFETNNN
jgi:hypothetical protein